MRRRVWVGRGICASMFLLTVATSAVAQAPPPKFAAILRDENALALSPTARSRGMGGTYVGVDEYWSNNPASIAGTEKLTAELGYVHWDHDVGPETDGGRIDLWAPVKILDAEVTLRLMGYYYITDEPANAVDPNLTDLEYESTTLGLQAGLNLTEWWAVGFGGYPYEKGEVEFDMPVGVNQTVHVESEAISQLGSVQLGTLFRLPHNVDLGAQFIYIIDELDDSYVDPSAVPFPQSDKDDYYIHYFALGASWEPVEWLLLGVDYWNGEAEGESAVQGEEWDKDVDRWNFGGELRPCEWVSLRLGSDNGGFTAGATLSLGESLDINYAYVEEAFRDKEDLWGETVLHTVSATIRF